MAAVSEHPCATIGAPQKSGPRTASTAGDLTPLQRSDVMQDDTRPVPRRPIPKSAMAAVAVRLGVKQDGTPHALECHYCGRPGELTWWSPGTFVERTYVGWGDPEPVDTIVPSQVFRAAWLEWDHVLPVHHGGTNDPDNLVLACQPCNCSKGKHTLQEWIDWLSTAKRTKVDRSAILQRLTRDA